MKVYLAGPEVFHPQAKFIFQQKINICNKHGVIPITPFDCEHTLTNNQKVAEIIYTQNMKLIDLCDGLIANITPFRGVHMDCGTSFEIGVAIAKNKPISCYTQNGGLLIDRLESKGGGGDNPVDKNGLYIENFNLYENLMINCAVLMQNRKIISVGLPIHNQLISIEGFEEALIELIKF